MKNRFGIDEKVWKPGTAFIGRTVIYIERYLSLLYKRTKITVANLFWLADAVTYSLFCLYAVLLSPCFQCRIAEFRISDDWCSNVRITNSIFNPLVCYCSVRCNCDSFYNLYCHLCIFKSIVFVHIFEVSIVYRNITLCCFCMVELFSAWKTLFYGC